MTQITTDSPIRQSDADPDPPTQRKVNDHLLTAINSGLFRYHLILRTPTPSPAHDPHYDPGAQEALGAEIARSLAARGISAIVCAAFQSINVECPTNHFHCLVNERPDYSWAKAFRAEFGRRAVHCVEIGPTPEDAAKIAHYVSSQSVLIVAAAPGGFSKTERIDQAAEIQGPIPPDSINKDLPEPGTINQSVAWSLLDTWLCRLEASLRPRPPPNPPDDDPAATRPQPKHRPLYVSKETNRPTEETNMHRLKTTPVDAKITQSKAIYTYSPNCRAKRKRRQPPLRAWLVGPYGDRGTKPRRWSRRSDKIVFATKFRPDELNAHDDIETVVFSL